MSCMFPLALFSDWNSHSQGCLSETEASYWLSSHMECICNSNTDSSRPTYLGVGVNKIADDRHGKPFWNLAKSKPWSLRTSTEPLPSVSSVVQHSGLYKECNMYLFFIIFLLCNGFDMQMSEWRKFVYSATETSYLLHFGDGA